MSWGFLLATALQITMGTAAPVGLAWLWRKRAAARGEGGASYRSLGMGALVFVSSQVVHLPLNEGLERAFGPTIRAQSPETALVWTALMLGLSAGICEECSRLVYFHFAGLSKKGTGRSRDEGVMVGLGHGGIESILFGTLLVFVTIAQFVAIDRAGLDSLGVDGPTRALVEAQLDNLHSAPFWSPLVGLAERLMVLPFHVSATMLVLYASVRRRYAFVLLAIAWHALLDAPTVWIMHTYGALAAELWVFGTVPVSLGIIVLVHRSLPAAPRAVADPRIDRAEPSGRPLELVLATKVYEGGHVALNEASLVLEPGSRTCLVGPNGAGKTTAIRLALGALAPTRGRVWLFGAAYDDDALVAAKRRVGVVPQQPGMYEDLTVREYLELVRDLYRTGSVDEVVQLLELKELLDRPMAHHSGGQQRRIALAAALLPRPELLVLDEPSAGLDPVAQRVMRQTLSEVGRGRTVLLCTHDLEEAEALSERVVILERGVVKVHERIDVLRSRIEPTLRLRARQAAGELADALRQQGLLGVEVEGLAARARLSGGRAAVSALLRRLLENGIDVEECAIEEASLEDIFLASIAHEERKARESLEPKPEVTDDSP